MYECYLINKNNMEHNHLSTETALAAIKTIMSCFQQQLVTKRLLQHINEYNQDYVSKIGHELTITQMKNSPISLQPNNKNRIVESWYQPQTQPKTTPIQNLSNWLVKIDSSSILQQHKTMKQQQQNRGTKSSFRYSRISNWSKKRQLPILPEKPAIPLKVPKQSEINQRDQEKLEEQIQYIQKKLYFERELKQKQEQQEQLRLYELRSRVPPQLPNGQFTYCFSGDFIRRKKHIKDQQHPVQQMSFTTSVNNTNEKQIVKQNTEKSQQTGSNFFNTRNTIGSRYKKASTFNNSNKRQVSHLPFIKMSDNTKMLEDNRISEGKLTQRNSLRSHAHSVDETNFKHHLQIQRQRKSIQKLRSMQQQSKYFTQKAGQQGVFQQQRTLGKSRQAYMMARYLKKLGKQKLFKGITQKNSNFQLTNVTNNSSIHRYYKYDFNNEKEKFFEKQFNKL